MSGSVNKVTILGNLAKDPEVKTFQNGGKVANLRVITSESWRDKQTGERKEKAEGHNVVIANENLIDFVQRFAKKGTKVYIEGRLETRSWDRNDGTGQKGYATEIVLRRYGGEFKIVGQPNGNRPQGGNEDSHGGAETGGNDNYGGGSGAGRDLDDDIPF